MTTASSGLFTSTTNVPAAAFHPLLALASFVFAANLRQSLATGSSADQADAALIWGL